MVVDANCTRARSTFVIARLPFARRDRVLAPTAGRTARPCAAAGRGYRARPPGRRRGPGSRPWLPGRPGGGVMNTVVCPSVTSTRSAIRASAVAVSRCSPGSSRISTGKPASRARAMPNRCRWPPDSRAPCSPTSVSRPSGSSSTQSSSRARSRAARKLGLGRVAAGQEEVLAQGGVEDMGVLGGQPDDPPDILTSQAWPARRRPG